MAVSLDCKKMQEACRGKSSLFGSDTQITHRRLVVLQLQAFVKVADADLLKRPLTFSLKSHTHRSHRSRSRFQNLLDKTWWAKRLHKSFGNFTRDRNWASGAFVANTPVPSGYELVGAVRNENAALWRIYQVSKEVIRLDCTKPLKEAPFKKWAPLTMEAAKGLDWGDLNFCEDANEWLLFHASIPEAELSLAGDTVTAV
ncbi:unnamed protein product [Cladocopium goreaui]|uniref:Bacilysin biosynthesis oxidoreductase BacC n=1 Tax=Cladocopium goreaui TaxID=2562237 RepID=A0A9P1C0D5_9DINO|nr:unnamed protein product [Cladocopium goreaui]